MDNDGCTGWFDGNWRHCCDIHDYNYYILNDKFLSDIDLMVCVLQTGNGVMALLMCHYSDGYFIQRKKEI